MLVASLIAIAIGIMVAAQPTDELDLDVLFPGLGNVSSDFRQAVPKPSDDGAGEASVVRWFLLVLTAVVAAPLAVPRRLFRFVLSASVVLVASFVAVSILRLGVLYVPTLALQVGALWVLYRQGHLTTSRSRATAVSLLGRHAQLPIRARCGNSRSGSLSAGRLYAILDYMAWRAFSIFVGVCAVSAVMQGVFAADPNFVGGVLGVLGSLFIGVAVGSYVRDLPRSRARLTGPQRRVDAIRRR